MKNDNNKEPNQEIELNRPILHLFTAKSIDHLIHEYENSIDSVVKAYSKKYNAPMFVRHGQFIADPHGTESRFILIVHICKDVQQKFEKELFGKDGLIAIGDDIMKDAMNLMKRMKGGDPDCQHEFQQGNDGLSCIKCGATL